MTTYDALIVGAGIFGITTAVTLQQRGYKTAVIDPGPIPHPLAASTDISKVIRMEYGSDETYMAMMEQALAGWDRWNDEFETPLYHETGVTMFAKSPIAPGDYEYESFQMMNRRGHQPEQMSAEGIPQRFPAWKPGAYVDGYYHARGGYAESGRVISALVDKAHRLGVAIIEGETAVKILTNQNQATGILTEKENIYQAEQIVIAAGSWTHLLIPELAPVMKATGHPVFHLKPTDPNLFTPPQFSVFTADIAHSGWYGFPLHPHEGVVKIANHGIGQTLNPRHDERIVTQRDEQNLRNFLADTFPSLLGAPIVYTRRCLYSDTRDEHFWIDRHPKTTGLTVAAGGSGHGFKFAPLLGSLIADAVENKTNPWLAKFQWRDLGLETNGEEAARFHGY